VIIEPVIGRASVRLGLAPNLRGRLASLSACRPLVIDYYTSRSRGVTTGDLIVWFGEPVSEPRYVELDTINDVTILADRHLVEVLEGATIREAGPPWHRHPAIALARPDAWIDFLDRHPVRRP
jgi:hypothetical protein